MISRIVIPTAKTKLKTSEGLDVAARYLVYKLYDASRGTSTAPSWQSVRALGEAAATVARAVERGWVVIRHGEAAAIRHEGSSKGKAKARSKDDLWAALTEEGRGLARKGLR
jgi:hypothetical protein